jgi:DnaK suppressor protein
MKLSEQERFRPTVEQRIRDVRDQLAFVDETAKPITPDAAIGRLSRVDAMQMQQMSMEVRRQREALLSRLERAQKLLDEGEFGTCPKCEEDIAIKRLKAMPDAIFCFDCASSME